MKTTVIIPTYNGAQKILHLLNALCKQTVRDFETIVVIDGSTDNTEQMVGNAKFELKNLRVIAQLNKGRAASRNCGAKESSGDILIFMDDDIEPKENVIELIAKYYSSGADSILVGHSKIDNRNKPTDFYNYRYYIEGKWDSALPEEKEHAISLHDYHFATAILSMPKKLFFSLSGFDERLNDSEDYDFSLRALIKQIPIWCNMEIFGWHRDFVDIEKYIRRQKEYKHSRLMLLKFHPEYFHLNPGGFAFFRRINNFKRIASFFFIYNSIWKVILNSKLFRLLSRQSEIQIL